MSEVRRRGASSGNGQAPERSLWYLGPGNIPVRHAGKPLTRATHWAHEGDTHWTPIEPTRKPAEG